MDSKEARSSGRNLQGEGAALDDVNRRLLVALSQDPRLGVSALARLVDMSAPAVRERLKRLEQAGVIRGYRVDVDPAALGLPVSAWVRIHPGPRQLSKLIELVAGIQQVSECHRITGEDCILLRVHVATIEDLEPLLDKFLVHGETTSSFIVSTPVAPRTILP